MAIDWPPQVVDAISRRRSVIVIGSGVSANACTDAGVRPPVWSAFLNTAYTKLGRRVPYIKDALTRYEYLAACDYLKSEYGADWPQLLRSSFAEPRYKSAEIHETIFNLDSRIVASLNFDKIYESYATTASDGTVVVKNYYDQDIRQVVAGGGRYIIKPHGDINTIPQVIFTHTDYAAARIKSAHFYEMMSALLHTHTFIMLGCGLSDPDIQVLFEDYRSKFDETAHYMTYASKLDAREHDLIQRTRGINVIPYSARNNHAELGESLKELVVKVNNKREALALDFNW